MDRERVSACGGESCHARLDVSIVAHWGATKRRAVQGRAFLIGVARARCTLASIIWHRVSRVRRHFAVLVATSLLLICARRAQAECTSANALAAATLVAPSLSRE